MIGKEHHNEKIRADTDSFPQVSKPGSAPEGSCDHRTVLLADDDDTILDVTSRMLERLGFTVVTAIDGVEAVSVFRERGGDFMFVILDISMPRMDGVEALFELRKIRDDVPYFLCSGSSEEEASLRLQLHRISGYINKPYRFSDMMNKLSQFLT